VPGSEVEPVDDHGTAEDITVAQRHIILHRQLELGDW
jgi:hypothetical protein